jgi:patatin-like phospholipase
MSDAYSPRLRTALVLTGTGTAGAYHAGALRALHEAGVKIDLVAGRGIGAVGALFVAIDGAPRLWEEKGFWRSPAVRALYRWRTVPRVLGWALALAAAIVALPIAVMVVGLVVFPIDFLLKIVGAGGASGFVSSYIRVTEAAFASGGLPTWLPRLVFLVLLAAAAVALIDGWTHDPRTPRGPFWWRALRLPLTSAAAADHTWRVLWDMLRGAAQLKQPPAAELGRRYVEVVAENAGQPGFRELLIAVHDVDARRDLLFALVGEPRRRDLVRRRTSQAAEARRAEIFDLAGTGRDYLADAVAAALTVPLATEPHAVTFAPDSYWRGETHRLCDRPAALIRLVDELIDLGVQQIVLVAATPDAEGPHTLTPPRVDAFGRLGEYVASAEAAVLRDATTTTPGVRIYTIRPVHNPIGPFDLSGGFDDRSHRPHGLDELMARGYEDAYHQFVEPVVGASGERLQTERV